ncbi:methyl-accepting chemotaxis protein [Rugamonas sp. DEMB1]|uniref:methyl-accepting chemotaxis protein n=1 Tax=Rugamonas sp. DEMB1 TaxID=3039386 RepID=UPI00244ACE6C|nr:methyl-accepting chemotaxis protein [Rugamonas sp. DEMB1]WGG52724.1 methyl-accepting chemotaxis protein [Rugamonas sp. DEMB1]
MFNNLLIKWKLASLVAIMMVALAVIGGSGYKGIATVGGAVNEIGVVRLPSIQGLPIMSEGQTAVAAATLTTAIYENDYHSQDKFAAAIKLHQQAWKHIDAGWKKYEPLPQTDEEAVLWKQFVAEFDAWKAVDGKIVGLMNTLAGNQDEQKQKDMFVEFYRQYELSRPLFLKAEATLMKIQDLNDAIAKASVQEGGDALVQAKGVMVGSALLAMLVAICCAVYITGTITRPLNEAVKVARTVASGDLSSRIEVRTTEETGQLLGALKEMNDSLVRIVGQVRAGTDTIATASTQIASGNLDLSSRTEEQASSLEETASSMEELTSTVRANADNVRQASALAASASGVALRGGQMVGRVVATMEAINQSSNKIVDIISVIDGIAFQTNILALNAAVEAARAGEQGRGFAVVASEVRNLAQRSATAAKEIKVLIGDSVGQVDAGSKLVAEAGATMDEIVASVKRVTDIMGDISMATQEQSAGIDQINVAVSQMDNVTQQNAALVEQAAAAAASLQEQAGGLAEVVSVFRIDSAAAARPAAPIVVAARRPLGSPAKPAKSIKPTLRLAATSKVAAATAEWETF